MEGLSPSLLLTAVTVALLHTVTGPDHYVPFVALAKARNWTMRRTLWVTGICGLGHVLSSLVLGGVGVALGVALGALESVEGHRGDVAAWALFGIGIAYGLWGVRQALRRREGHSHLLQFHRHEHTHDGVAHSHAHDHGPGPGHGSGQGHDHTHGNVVLPAGGAEVRRQTTFWALFIVFVLGPCEPLIPLFMVPASERQWGAACVLGAAFGVVTLATMLTITALGVYGMARLSLGGLQRWVHALAGGMIATSAGAVLFLGL
ncbi:MAG: hypothetical protein JNN13_19895 [Planctomycetes bacterium]|nr:hypothetical protein [Planctomycetota bacterium]